MKIDLIPLKESNFTQIIEWVNTQDEDFIVQWAGLTYDYPLTLNQMNEHYNKGINSKQSDVFLYKIMENDRFIGTIQLCRFDWDHMEAVIGRFLIGEEKNRGRGVGKQALKQLVKMGFNEFKLKAIKLNVFDFNTHAISCYESIGFRKTLCREKIYQDKSGCWWNNYEMILSKNDWLEAAYQGVTD